MIITVTPNPAIDRTFQLNELAVGEVNRAIATRVDAGGKGINISRALHMQNIPTVAVFPASGDSGTELVNALLGLGINANPVFLAGETRSNITLVDSAGVTTKINASGPVLTPDGEAALLQAVREVVISVRGGARLAIVGAGSLPEGADPHFYAKLAQLGAELGVQVTVDTSGQPLAHAVTAGGLAAVKPNLDELSEYAGRPLHTIGDVVGAARKIIAHGTKSVLVSLGEQGALLVTPETWAWAGGGTLVPVSTVGAGDATLAGFLSTTYSSTMTDSSASTNAGASTNSGASTNAGTVPELETLVREALRTGVVWGRAAVLQPGTAAPQPQDLHPEQVTVIVQPDQNLPIEELLPRQKLF